MRSRATPNALACSLCAALLLLGVAPAHAQKTDSVWIRNGDRITGEVKSLERGLLRYSTDDLGTISIEWDKVERISTRTVLEVQLSSGAKFYGPLGVAPNGWLVLGRDTLSLRDIVAMAPIKKRKRDRWDGYLDLGFSFQSANTATQLSSGGKGTYRAPTAETTIEFTTFLESRDDATENRRLATSFTERFLLPDRWSTGVVLGYETNEELDLAGRGRAVLFGGRTIAQDHHIELLATGGLMIGEERYFSTDSSSTSFEGLLGGAFRAFRYDRPKLDALVRVQAFPSFSTLGRVRMQSDVRVSYELVKDFMVTVSVYDAFDSKPPSVDAPKHDFGTTLSISWTF